MKKAVNIVILGAILLGCAQAATYAQARMPGFPPGKWWKDRRFAEELKLSPDQQTRIEAIWMENRKRLIDQKAELDKSQFDLNDVLSKDPIDEAAALKAFEQVQSARVILERTTFAMRVRTKNILSPEQQQKLEEISERLRRERGLPASGVPPRPLQ